MDKQLLNYLKINSNTDNSKFNALLGKGPSEELEIIFKLAKNENINPFEYYQHKNNIYSDYYHNIVAKKILSYCHKLDNKEDAITYLNYLIDNGLRLTLNKFNDENENPFNIAYYPYLYSFLKTDNIKKENKFLSSYIVEQMKKENNINEEALLQSISHAYHSNSRSVDSSKSSQKEKSLFASTKNISSQLAVNHLQTLFFDGSNIRYFSFTLDEILFKYKELKNNNYIIQTEAYNTIYFKLMKSYSLENNLKALKEVFSVQEINDLILSPNISMMYNYESQDKVILKMQTIEPEIKLNNALISSKQKYDIISYFNQYKFDAYITNSINNLKDIGFTITTEDIFNYMSRSVNELRSYNIKDDFLSCYIQTLIDKKNDYENLSELLDYCYNFFNSPIEPNIKIVNRELTNINLFGIFNISTFDDDEFVNIINKMTNIYNIDGLYNTGKYAKIFCEKQMEHMLKNETLRLDENIISKYVDNKLNPLVLSLNKILDSFNKSTFTEYETKILNSELLWNEDLYPKQTNFIQLYLDNEKNFSQQQYLFGGTIMPFLEKINKNPWTKEYNNSTTLFDKVIKQTDLLIKKDILPPIVQRWIESNKHYLEKGDNINLDNISNEPLKIYLSKIVLEKTFENSKTPTSKKRL